MSSQPSTLRPLHRSPVPASRKEDTLDTSDTLDALPSPTRRELEVLGLVYTGMASQAVADALFIDKRTVDFHLANLYRKWRVKNRNQAIRYALQQGLISV